MASRPRTARRSAAFEEGPDRAVTATGFLVDMAKVFEDVVGRRLAHALALFGGRLNLQQVDTLDVEGRLAVRRDFVWTDGGRTLGAGDFEYHDATGRSIPPGHLYQALAYAHRYRLRAVHLIYAGDVSWERATVGDVALQCHAVHLAVDLDDQLGARPADCVYTPTQLKKRIEGSAVSIFTS